MSCRWSSRLTFGPDGPTVRTLPYTVAQVLAALEELDRAAVFARFPGLEDDDL